MDTSMCFLLDLKKKKIIIQCWKEFQFQVFKLTCILLQTRSHNVTSKSLCSRTIVYDGPV